MLYTIQRSQVTLRVEDNGKVVCYPTRLEKEKVFCPHKMNVSVGINSEKYPPTGGDLQLKSHRFENNRLKLVFAHGEGLKVETVIDCPEGVSAFRQVNTVRNTTDHPIILNYLSSAYLDNLCFPDGGEWYRDEKLKVHYCNNTWEKEGQWKCVPIRTFGVMPGTRHEFENTDFSISSVGSQATRHYYPMMLLEDCPSKAIWFMEIEGANDWDIQLGQFGNLSESNVSLQCSAANEENGGWFYRLMPGESYSSVPATFGCADGGWNEAIAEITKMHRIGSLISPESYTIPVVFNDYMDCLWCERNEEKMTALIQAAADVGCEYFVIDAGWHMNGDGVTGSWGASLGDWLIDDTGFGAPGLQGTLNRIREHGMIPGIWFEMDAATPNASIYRVKDALLTRHGEIITKPRAFLNMRCEAVRTHLKERVGELYRMGVRYIKNDYNNSTSVGTDMYGETPAEGLVRNSEAFLSLMDEIRELYPDLILENCGSGGMREDAGTLRHFHLQSTSDQELYRFYPSILSGSLAFIAPEKAGIWSYPYPLMLEEHNLPITKETFAGMEDGEETVFNMVSGMCGSLYLSGRIDCADEKNKNLIRESIQTYKEYRDKIKTAVPYYPLGLKNMHDGGFQALGLKYDEGCRMLLAVWKEGTEEDTVSIPLPGLDSSGCVSVLYPKEDKKVRFSVEKECLIVHFPGGKTNMARLFTVKL